MVRLSLNVDQETYDSAGRSFDPVPVGRYRVSIFEIKEDVVKTGANKGKPRLKFQFRIADGEEAPDGSRQSNRRLFKDVNNFEGVSKETGEPTPAYDLLDIAKALGISAEELKDAETDDWQGEELYLSVIHKNKQHKVGEKWVDIEPAEKREEVRGFRSLASVETSVAATAKVTGKAPTGAKASTATGRKAPSLIKL